HERAELIHRLVSVLHAGQRRDALFIPVDLNEAAAVRCGGRQSPFLLPLEVNGVEGVPRRLASGTRHDPKDALGDSHNVGLLSFPTPPHDVSSWGWGIDPATCPFRDAGRAVGNIPADRSS